MSCFRCRCNTCVRSAELFSGYFTPGEIQDVEQICYTCDECRWWDGDHRKRSQWRDTCPGYMEPIKYADMRARAARSKFTVLPGGKDST
ncbi:hypothetical protein [Dysosmobacter sp.]